MQTMRFPPLTVEEAADYLRANMPAHYEAPLAAMKKEELSDLQFSLGAFASNILGLWSGNEELLESCRLASGNKDLDVDDASMLILSRLWEKMQKEDDAGPGSGGIPDEQGPVTADDVLMSEVVQSEALINLLERKGIISREELREEIMRVKTSAGR